MRYFECTWLVSNSNWTSFELSPWVWQAQLSPTASVDDITELCFIFFDVTKLPWQVLMIAESKLQPDDPLLMGLGRGEVFNWQPKLRNLFIYDESSSRFECSASVHRLASADGSMVTQGTQFNYDTDSIHCRGPDKNGQIFPIMHNWACAPAETKWLLPGWNSAL